MGLLALGTPLNWEQTKPLADHIRNHGITQFLNTWNRWKDVSGKGLLWGDEVGPNLWQDPIGVIVTMGIWLLAFRRTECTQRPGIAADTLVRSSIWWSHLMMRTNGPRYHFDKLKS